MLFVVLNKPLNCTAENTIEVGHTANTDCNYQLFNNTVNNVSGHSKSAFAEEGSGVVIEKRTKTNRWKEGILACVCVRFKNKRSGFQNEVL